MTDNIVLCYHALSHEWNADLSATPERFERQLQLLVDRGYRGVRFSDAVGFSGRERIVAVTFDDAYLSVGAIARPILERFGLPATVFVPTDYVGSGGVLRWPGIQHWLDGPFAEELTPMTWAELESLADAGWEIGSHTGSHAHLTQLDDTHLQDELVRSKAACEEHLSRPCTSLAYPYGDFDPRVVAAARRAGYTAAATLPSRLSLHGPLEWPRVGVYHDDDDLRFRLKLSPAVRQVRRSAAWNLVARSEDGTAVPSESAGESRRSNAGFFSSAKSFFLPIGPAIDPAGVHGYPIDMRVKARSAEWPAPEIAEHLHMYVSVAQYGLGAHERWLAGDGEQWLTAARAAAEYLISNQEPDGSWLHTQPFAHTFPLAAPWRCGMVQGEAASLLVRMHLSTGEELFCEPARRALAPLYRSTSEGGVQAALHGRPWPEEYPTDPPSFVLNGAIFALWGMRDVGVGLADAEATLAFREGVDSLAANLHRFDNGWWSLYSLFPHPIVGVASSFYHDLHISQLKAMDELAPRPEFEPVSLRWASYAASPWNRRHAFASKAAFRILVPRNRLMARRMPWTRL